MSNFECILESDPKNSSPDTGYTKQVRAQYSYCNSLDNLDKQSRCRIDFLSTRLMKHRCKNPSIDTGCYIDSIQNSSLQSNHCKIHGTGNTGNSENMYLLDTSQHNSLIDYQNALHSYSNLVASLHYYTLCTLNQDLSKNNSLSGILCIRWKLCRNTGFEDNKYCFPRLKYM